MPIISRSYLTVLLWIFRKPALTEDYIDKLYTIANKEKTSNFLISGLLWIILNIVFIVVSVKVALIIIGLLINPTNPVDNNWLNPGSPPTVMFGGIFCVLMSIFIGFCISSSIWYAIMKYTNFINDATIELIIRNGPFPRRNHKK